VVSVITRRDRRRGRSGGAAPSPVKTAALEWGFPVEQPETAADLAAVLAETGADVGVVVAYGRLLDRAALASTRVGFVNVHFSLLPHWRGAAPVERSIMAGDSVTGVSLMRLDEGLDTGPIIAVDETDIAEDDTGGSLTARLADLGGQLLADHLLDYLAGSLHPADQIDTAASYAPRLSTEEARLDPDLPAAVLTRTVRALHPRPGAWLSVEGSRLGVVRAADVPSGPDPGSIERLDGLPVLGTSEGGLALLEVVAAGRRSQPGSVWMHGRRGAPARVER
jgi:methionyl-tRNA formyltransferase